LVGHRARLATKLSHRRFRRPIRDRSLRPHVYAEQSSEDLQLLGRRPPLLSTQPQRRSIGLDDELAGLTHPAQALVKVGETLFLGELDGATEVAGPFQPR